MEVAADAEAALTVLQARHFDALVTDVILPGSSGLDLLSAAKQLDPNLEVVVITALDKVDPAVRAMKSGASDYLVKPVTPEALQHAVQRSLSTRAAAGREHGAARPPQALRDLPAARGHPRPRPAGAHGAGGAWPASAAARRRPAGRAGRRTTLGPLRRPRPGVPAGGRPARGRARRPARRASERGVATPPRPAGERPGGAATPSACRWRTRPAWWALALAFPGEPARRRAAGERRLPVPATSAWPCATWAGFKQVEHLAYLDDLTHLYNTRYLDVVLERELAGGRPFTLLFIDLDHFKAVNDQHGHLSGSRLLVEVARVLRSCVRDEDVLVRYGGDEYVMLLVGIDSGGGLKVAERVRRAIEDHRFLSREATPVRVTASIGLACLPRARRDQGGDHRPRRPGHVPRQADHPERGLHGLQGPAAVAGAVGGGLAGPPPRRPRPRFDAAADALEAGDAEEAATLARKGAKQARREGDDLLAADLRWLEGSALLSWRSRRRRWRRSTRRSARPGPPRRPAGAGRRPLRALPLRRRARLGEAIADAARRTRRGPGTCWACWRSGAATRPRRPAPSAGPGSSTPRASRGPGPSPATTSSRRRSGLRGPAGGGAALPRQRAHHRGGPARRRTTSSTADPPLSPTILGLFRGAPYGQKVSADPWSHLPSSIVLYQRNLERAVADREELEEQIAITLVHEVGHFLGLDEEELGGARAGVVAGRARGHGVAVTQAKRPPPARYLATAAASGHPRGGSAGPACGGRAPPRPGTPPPPPRPRPRR